MSNRLLAVSLALTLALPLFLSLDGDLFDPATDARPAGDPAAAIALPDAEALEQELRAQAAIEAARRFSVQAVEAMEKEAQGLEDSVTWRSAPEATPDR